MEGGSLPRVARAALSFCVSLNYSCPGQWKEYSKIKNASGPGVPWTHGWWKQPWEEGGLPALCPGVGWASGGLEWGGPVLPVLTEAGLHCAPPGARPGDVGSCVRTQVLQSGEAWWVPAAHNPLPPAASSLPPPDWLSPPVLPRADPSLARAVSPGGRPLIQSKQLYVLPGQAGDKRLPPLRDSRPPPGNYMRAEAFWEPALTSGTSAEEGCPKAGEDKCVALTLRRPP